MGNVFITEREAMRLTGEVCLAHIVKQDAQNYLSEHPPLTQHEVDVLRLAFLKMADAVADVVGA